MKQSSYLSDSPMVAFVLNNIKQVVNDCNHLSYSLFVGVGRLSWLKNVDKLTGRL